MKTRSAIVLHSLLVLCLLAGCGTEPVREELFVEQTGLTWASMNDPIVLARNVPGFAVATRDYLYIGPVETNRRGTLEHYLWIGSASTVDRELRGNTLPSAEALLILADGAPIILELDQWSPGFDAAPYGSPVPTSHNWGARVSMNQIQKIAQSTTVEIRLASESDETAPYVLWHGSWESWQGFPIPGAGSRTQASR